MNPHVESYIQKNIPWSQLPENVQQQLGNSQKEYDKSVVTFSVRNQVRFRGSLVRYVRKDEKKVGEIMIELSLSLCIYFLLLLDLWENYALLNYLF